MCNPEGYAAFSGVVEYVLDKAQLPDGDRFVPLPDDAEAEFEAELQQYAVEWNPNKVSDTSIEVRGELVQL